MNNKEENASVYFRPEGDRACVEVSSSGQLWVKDYQSMPDATGDAVQLRLMKEYDKALVDQHQRQPSYPHDYKTKANVDLLVLARNGFRCKTLN
jgi:hypothetical protein